MAQNKPRVLILSHRFLAYKILARCIWYEFEDLIKDIDHIELIAPKRLTWFERRYVWAQRVGRRLSYSLNPGVPVTDLNQDYDLFFSMCAFPTDLLYLNAIRDWRKRCRVAICWIDEVLVNNIEKIKYFNKTISQFDHVLVSCTQGIEPVQKLIRGQCRFVLPGVDALLFCPCPEVPERFIDILSIGRRSEPLHAELIKAFREKGLFYFYDTISGYGCEYGLTTSEPSHHRLLFANLVKRSRYFIVNPGKFDEPGVMDSEEIIGARYVEGAAAGALMLGKEPRNPEFRTLFSWPDAVIDIVSEGGEILKILTEEKNNATRWDAVRKNNVLDSLLHHDWVYRWEEIIKLAELEPAPKLLQRKEQLARLVAYIEKNGLTRP